MGATVTVACKLPNGLKLRVFEFVKGSEPVLGGGTREVQVPRQVGEAVEVKGFSIPRGPDFDPEKMPPMSGGFALTPGVDADFFEKWMEQNKDSQVVREGLIFAHEKSSSARDEAKEKAELRSGLEPLAQGADPRAPRGVRAAAEKPAEA